jgi:hypothetical protein
VVVHGLARNVGVVAVRQVEPLDGVELGEYVEGAEDRRPTDPLAPPARIGDEIGGREMARTSGDQVGDRSSSVGQSIAGVIEDGADGDGAGHGQMILSLS